VKEYKGSVYIAVTGSENENGVARDSIENIIIRKKDTRPQFIRATKGYEARQMHLNNWYEKSKHPFILFLDSDMIFPVNILERLRAHKAPFVSGFYMRRTIRPVAPVWFERGADGVMPLKPLMAVLEKDKTYPIGASGWGCILIHRDVITAMKPILKGEPEIIEDDMDIYPYDLKEVLAGREQIKPLRGLKDTVGSDIRFPFYAQLAGFPLLGDTGALCEHLTNYPVSIDDWLNQPAYSMRDLSLYINEDQRKEVERIRKATNAN